MHLLLGGEFVTAVWAAVRVLEPLLNALVSENMFAFWQADRLFDNAVWVLNAEFVIADHTSYKKLARALHFEMPIVVHKNLLLSASLISFGSSFSNEATNSLEGTFFPPAKLARAAAIRRSSSISPLNIAPAR
jgi:hypothetical protein